MERLILLKKIHECVPFRKRGDMLSDSWLVTIYHRKSITIVALFCEWCNSLVFLGIEKRW